jgi:hypothetical protein
MASVQAGFCRSGSMLERDVELCAAKGDLRVLDGVHLRVVAAAAQVQPRRETPRP